MPCHRPQEKNVGPHVFELVDRIRDINLLCKGGVFRLEEDQRYCNGRSCSSLVQNVNQIDFLRCNSKREQSFDDAHIV